MKYIILHLNILLCHSFVIKNFTPSIPNNYKIKTNTLLYATEESLPYQRQTEETPTNPQNNKPFPKIGDIVRYYELDGGKLDGQVFVGKISFIQQRTLGEKKEFLIDISELDDLGNGYYTEYSGRKRQSKKCTKMLQDIAPVRASFVRSEDAFKVPLDSNGRPNPYVDSYNYEDYTGPIPIDVNKEVVDEDGERYNELKSQLLLDTAIVGAIGVIVAQLVKGTEDAVIYGLGALASIGYLYFLSVKTDTVASPSAKLGSNVSNIRFILPVFVLISIAIRNTFFTGNTEPIQPFSTVTPEQFASAIIGFLTYRIPLFTRQISNSIDIGSILPGSAAIAYQAAQEYKESQKNNLLVDDGIQRTIFLISGPLSSGKTTLVNKLLQEDDRFTQPNVLDKLNNGAKIEILEKQNAILSSDDRNALTEESLLNSFQDEKVVVLDADVDLSQKILPIASRNNINVIGVWVSLDSMEKFEDRLKHQISNENIPEDETPETLLRGRTRNVIRDIEFGIVSGVFDFTILNDDLEESWGQLRDACAYCFK